MGFDEFEISPVIRNLQSFLGLGVLGGVVDGQSFEVAVGWLVCNGVEACRSWGILHGEGECSVRVVLVRKGVESCFGLEGATWGTFGASVSVVSTIVSGRADLSILKSIAGVEDGFGDEFSISLDGPTFSVVSVIVVS